MKELSKEQTEKLLDNYRTWAMDDPPNYAEVDYYTVCPDFVHIIKHGSSLAYDDRQAWLVEEVMRVLHETDIQAYKIIQRIYGWGWTQEKTAKEFGTSARTLVRSYIPAAQDSFAREWANFFLDPNRKPWA